MAEDAGTIEASIRIKLDEMENDLLQGQKRLDHFAKELAKQGEKGGTLYVKGFSKADVELNAKLNNMVNSFASISPKFGKIGESLAKGFSKPIFAMVPKVAAAFTAMLGVIGVVIAAIGALAAGIGKLISAHRENVKTINDHRKANEDLRKSGEELAAGDGVEIKKLEEKDKKRKKAIAAMKEYNHIALAGKAATMAAAAATDAAAKAQKKFADTFPELNKKIEDTVDATKQKIKAWTEESQLASTIIGKAKELIAARKEEAAQKEEARQAEAEAAEAKEREKREAKVLKEATKELAAAQADYGNKLRLVAAQEKAGASTSAEAARARVSAHKEYMESLIRQREETIRLAGAESQRARELDGTIARMREIIALEGQRAEAAAAGEIVDRIEAEYARLDRELTRMTRNGLKSADDATSARYSALQGYLEEINNAIITTQQSLNSFTGIPTTWTTDQRRQYEELHQQLNKLRAAEEKYKTFRDGLQRPEPRRSGGPSNIEKEITLQDKLRQIEEQREAAKKNAEANYQTLLRQGMKEADAAVKKKEQEEQAMAGIYSQLHAIKLEYSDESWQKLPEDHTRAWLELLEEVGEEVGGLKKEEANWLAAAMGMTEKQFGEMMAVADASIAAFDQITSAAMDITKKQAEARIAVIEAHLEKVLNIVEDARQAELEAQGFIQAQSEEEYDKQIERAKASGDQVLQYQIQRRKREAEINNKYDQQKKEAEEKAAREKAQIEYKLAKQEHAMNLIKAANAMAMAIANALSSAMPPANFILAALSGGAVAVQIGLLAANPPKPPAFKDGGIVPGRKADGDSQHILATAGEVILNEAQQETVADKLKNKMTYLTVVLQMDSVEVARSSAEVYGSGRVLIPARGIA